MSMSSVATVALAKNLSPTTVRNYLVHLGWNIDQEDHETVSILSGVGRDGNTYRVMVPLDPSFVDFHERFNEALQRLVEAENTEPVELIDRVFHPVRIGSMSAP